MFYFTVYYFCKLIPPKPKSAINISPFKPLYKQCFKHIKDVFSIYFKKLNITWNTQQHKIFT